MKKLLLFVAVLLVFGCKQKDQVPATVEPSKPALNELQTKVTGLFGELPLVAENQNNPVTEEKVVLGKKLYFDNLLSKNKTESCNTCHNLDTYGVDNHQFSPGDKKGTSGGRNAPTTLNAALHFVQFWDGRAADVEEQAGGPVMNPVEMGMPDEKFVLERLKADKDYPGLFAKAFPESKDAVTIENMRKAIGAFERKLMTPSKFDAYMKGDSTALTAEQTEGLKLFVEKGCTSCHMGNAIGGSMYQKFGVYGDYWKMTKSQKIDEGRSLISKNAAEKYFFKVPSLRNISKTYPYFHDGSVKDLKEAVKIMGKLQLNLDLTPQEVDKISAFLDSLTGEVPAELKNK